MEKKETKHQMIRQLRKDEKIPYDLLLLADETREVIDKYIFGSDIFVLEQESKTIAAYVLKLTDKNMVEIKNMAVAAECQGQGMGKLLLRDAVCRAKGKGVKTIIIGQGMLQLNNCICIRKKDLRCLILRKAFSLIIIQSPFMKTEYN